MMAPGDARHGRTRGQPLVMLAVLLSCWAGLRILTWDSTWPGLDTMGGYAAPQLAAREVPPGPTANPAQPASAQHTKPPRETAMRGDGGGRPPHGSSTIAPTAPAPPLHWPAQAAPPLQPSARAAGGHQLLWMAAMAHLPVPEPLGERLAQVVQPAGAAPAVRVPSAYPQIDRWSLDGWALWREGSGRALAGEGRVPTYGASQAGAVLRYRLAPGDAHEPRAYARAYRALVDGGESELAAGLSARPIAQLPLRAHGEVRATGRDGAVELRPAAFVTSEFAPLALPAGLRAEAYFQAGYVAGEDATGFADGQVHLLREVAGFDLGRVSLGAAAWGGAQEGAQRIDLGPSIRLDLTLGEVPARLSLDYRERVAGEAEPPSGTALTLSTRF